MSEPSIDNAIKLYTVQEIADITKIPRDTLQNWWSRPNQKYQMPAPFAVTGPSKIKLWSAEQVEEIKRDAVKHRQMKEAARNTTRAVKMREQQKKYKENARKRKEADHAKALEEAKARIELRALEEKQEADRVFIEEFEREREEKALAILMGNK